MWSYASILILILPPVIAWSCIPSLRLDPNPHSPDPHPPRNRASHPSGGPPPVDVTQSRPWSGPEDILRGLVGSLQAGATPPHRLRFRKTIRADKVTNLPADVNLREQPTCPQLFPTQAHSSRQPSSRTPPPRVDPNRTYSVVPKPV